MARFSPALCYVSDDERANVLNKDKMGVFDVYRLRKKDGSDAFEGYREKYIAQGMDE